MKGRIKKIFLITAAAYVALVILAASILGIVVDQRLVASYNTARVDKEMYAYFQAQQRYQYVVEIANTEAYADDTPLFWRGIADKESGKTHNQVVEKQVRDYVAAVVASAYLFDQYGFTLTDDDRDAVEANINQIVEYRFKGDKKAYDACAEKYGFDLAAATRAELLVRKLNIIMVNMSADLIQSDAHYASQYVRVKMVCVNVDSPGYSETCTMLRMDLARPDSEETLAAGEDEFSDAVVGNLNADDALRNNPEGYYFGRDEVFTEAIREELPEVVDAAFAIEKVGEYKEITIDVANDETGKTETRTYFIRRYPLAPFAYLESDYEDFFENFDTNASMEYYGKLCETYMKKVEWKAKNRPSWKPLGQKSDWEKLF